MLKLWKAERAIASSVPPPASMARLSGRRLGVAKVASNKRSVGIGSSGEASQVELRPARCRRAAGKAAALIRFASSRGSHLRGDRALVQGRSLAHLRVERSTAAHAHQSPLTRNPRIRRVAMDPTVLVSTGAGSTCRPERVRFSKWSESHANGTAGSGGVRYCAPCVFVHTAATAPLVNNAVNAGRVAWNAR
jgi:hypothetical protein